MGNSFYQRRRRSSAATSHTPQELNLESSSVVDSKAPRGGHRGGLSPIPGTPSVPMTLSRSPSPVAGGGWSSPGLTSDVTERSSTSKSYRMNGGSNVTWESAKAKSEGVNGYPSFSTHNNGFFSRHYRRISSSLPHFNMGDKTYAEKEKLERGRWIGRDGSKLARVRSLARRVSRKLRLRGLIVIALIFLYFIFYMTRKSSDCLLWASGDGY